MKHFFLLKFSYSKKYLSQSKLKNIILLSSYIRPGGRIVLHDMGLDYWGQEVRQGVKNFLKQHPQKLFCIEGEIGLISL